MPTQSLLLAGQNLAAALAADAELTAWCDDHFNTTLKVFPGRAAGPVADDPQAEELPAAVIENGVPVQPEDGISRIATIGGQRAHLEASFAVGLIWKESDVAKAFIQRLSLIDVMGRLMMRQRTLSGAVGAAYLEAWQWQEAKEPTYLAMFRIRVQYNLAI